MTLDSKTIFAGFTLPPSVDDIQAIAEEIISDLPKGIEKYIGKLNVVVEDFPDDYIQEELEVETPFDLLGCYQSSGPAAIGGHLATNMKRRDSLYLYRRPILDAWAETEEDLNRIINRVLLQEIGHHFGMTPDEIDMYEEEMFGTTLIMGE